MKLSLRDTPPHMRRQTVKQKNKDKPRTRMTFSIYRVFTFRNKRLYKVLSFLNMHAPRFKKELGQGQADHIINNHMVIH